MNSEALLMLAGNVEVWYYQVLAGLFCMWIPEIILLFQNRCPWEKRNSPIM